MRRPRRLFAFRLAAILGCLDVDGMLSRLPRRLMDEWRGYMMLEPHGAVEDERRAILSGVLAGGGKPDVWLHRPPRLPLPPQSREDMDAAIDAL